MWQYHIGTERETWRSRRGATRGRISGGRLHSTLTSSGAVLTSQLSVWSTSDGPHNPLSRVRPSHRSDQEIQTEISQVSHDFSKKKTFAGSGRYQVDHIPRKVPQKRAEQAEKDAKEAAHRVDAADYTATLERAGRTIPVRKYRWRHKRRPPSGKPSASDGEYHQQLKTIWGYEFRVR